MTDPRTGAGGRLPDGRPTRRRARVVRRDPTRCSGDVPDYPEPGILFQDITPLLADADGARRTSSRRSPRRSTGAGRRRRRHGGARLPVAAPVAVALGAGVPAAPQGGQAPGPTVAQSYDARVRHGGDRGAPGNITAGARVLVIDDVLATGGTAAAAVELLSAAGPSSSASTFLLELAACAGRDQLAGPTIDVAGRGALTPLDWPVDRVTPRGRRLAPRPREEVR